MYKDNLFQLIREEEVVIWAGAGMSRYAGFPLGNQLCEILLESLSKSEKAQINSSLHLSDLAEEFYRLKGSNKNALIKILQKAFVDCTPTSTEWHDKIASITHFKTIITTNYDKMFEKSLGPKGQMIISSSQIPYIDKNKTNVFKVHGDLSEPGSVIITKSDYNNFFKTESHNNIFWSVVKERLSTKSVLFLGYDLEDPNVSVVFEKILETLDVHRKECFLVAPDLKQHKITDLIRKGIHYINATAEELIDELLKDIKENILSDLEKGKTSADTVRGFSSNYNLSLELSSNKDSYKISGLKGINGIIESKINLTLKNDHKLINELNDFVAGKNANEFEISDDNLLNTIVSVGGFKLPFSEQIIKLNFKRAPNIESFIDIRFDDGFEIIDIPYKLFVNAKFVEVHVVLKTAILNIEIDLDSLPNAKFNFNIQHNEICGRIKDEIELYTLLYNLGEGKPFELFPKTFSAIRRNVPPIPQIKKIGRQYLDYFEKLKKIENHHKIIFSNISFSALTNENYSLMSKIIYVIENKTKMMTWKDELVYELDDIKDTTIEEFKIVNEANGTFEIAENHEEIVELHGHNFNLGYKRVIVMESYISNLSDIVENKIKFVKIKSKSNKMAVLYTKELDERQIS